MILVRFWFRSPLDGLAATMKRTSEPLAYISEGAGTEWRMRGEPAAAKQPVRRCPLIVGATGCRNRIRTAAR
jgi:hypothetical protein